MAGRIGGIILLACVVIGIGAYVAETRRKAQWRREREQIAAETACDDMTLLQRAQSGNPFCQFQLGDQITTQMVLSQNVFSSQTVDLAGQLLLAASEAAPQTGNSTFEHQTRSSLRAWTLFEGKAGNAPSARLRQDPSFKRRVNAVLNRQE